MPSLIQGPPASQATAVVRSEDPGQGWDAFMAGHPFGHLMQSRAWARVRQETGWEAIYVSLEEQDRIRAAALCLRRAIPGTPMGLLYLPRGPVLDYADPSIVRSFGETLSRLAEDRRAFLIQADPAIPECHQEAHTALEALGFRRQEKHGVFRVLQPRWVMRIPVNRYGGPDGLLASLSHKTRYNIRLAERKGVRVTPREDYEACRIFYRLLGSAARAKGFPVRGFRFHEAIWRHCVRAGLGEYLFAEHDDRLLAAIQVLRFGPTAWYMYGASSEVDRHLMPTYLLQWEGIRRAWSAGCRCYDMRGAPSAAPKPEDPEHGVYDFKRKFNAELVPFLGEYDLVVRPRLYAVWRLVERAIQGPAAWAFRLKQRAFGS